MRLKPCENACFPDHSISPSKHPLFQVSLLNTADHYEDVVQAADCTKICILNDSVDLSQVALPESLKELFLAQFDRLVINLYDLYLPSGPVRKHYKVLDFMSFSLYCVGQIEIIEAVFIGKKFDEPQFSMFPKTITTTPPQTCSYRTSNNEMLCSPGYPLQSLPPQISLTTPDPGSDQSQCSYHDQRTVTGVWRRYGDRERVR